MVLLHDGKSSVVAPNVIAIAVSEATEKLCCKITQIEMNYFQSSIQHCQLSPTLCSSLELGHGLPQSLGFLQPCLSILSLGGWPTWQWQVAHGSSGSSQDTSPQPGWTQSKLNLPGNLHSLQPLGFTLSCSVSEKSGFSFNHLKSKIKYSIVYIFVNLSVNCLWRFVP